MTDIGTQGMYQWNHVWQWRDNTGQAWNIHQTVDPGVTVWRARCEGFWGKNIANLLTRDCDSKRLSFAFLADIHIDSSVENRGLGSMLLTLVIAACRARMHQGIEGDLVEVDSGHFDKLKHFYEKFGFTVTFYTPGDPRYDRQRRGEIRLEF